MEPARDTVTMNAKAPRAIAQENRPAAEDLTKPIKKASSLSPITEAGLSAIRPNMNPLYRFMKRLLDIVISSIGLILASPVFLITIIAIKLEDPKGKVFFNQLRFGKNCTHFLMYKFRSMFSNAEEMMTQLTLAQQREWEEHFKLKKDPRITKVGNILRKTSFDELPQLLNILKGDMSLVGPRPPLLDEETKYGNTLQTVMSVRPGLTGYWQVYGRNDIAFNERIRMNLEYIQNRSIGMDIRILIKTISAVFNQEGV